MRKIVSAIFIVSYCMIVPFFSYGFELRGKITEFDTGNIITNAVVEILEAKKDVVSDAAGNYSIKCANMRNITVSVKHLGYHPITKTVKILNNDVANVDFQLEQSEFTLKDITVTRNLRKEKDHVELLRTTLDNYQANTLGETLSKIPGVQNSFFGPNSGNTVIRSLDGNRVSILSDGLLINNLSGISPNFNVNVNQDNIEEIDVYKNSMSVLYGGKAIGGAVNIEDNTIQTKIPQKPVAAKVGMEGGYNSGMKQFFSVLGAINKHWAWNVGASNHTGWQVHIPGNTKPDVAYDPKFVGFDPILQSMAQVNVDAEHVLNTTIYPYISRFVLDHMVDYELSENDKWTFRQKDSGYDEDNIPNPDYVPGQDIEKDKYKDVVRSISDYYPVENGIIPNSHSQANSANIGVSFIKDNYLIGGGYTCDYSYYGVPVYAKHPDIDNSHSHGDGSIHIDVKKFPFKPVNVRSFNNTISLKGELREPFLVFDRMKLHLSEQLSQDKELLDKEAISTFDTRRESLRLELYQKELPFLAGITGVDYAHAYMDGSGNSRYLPDNKSREIALFTNQTISWKCLKAILGYRHDFINRSANKNDGYKGGRGLAGGNLTARHFDLNQFNSELRANILGCLNLGVSFNHSQRAPEVNELYAGNNHYVIAVEENGDDMLHKEIANAVELKGGFSKNNFSVSVNFYNVNYKNYIYLAHTGVTRSLFVVKEWRNTDTRISGVETEVSYKLNLNEYGTWDIGCFYDLVKSKNVSKDKMHSWAEGDYTPNLPTSRAGFNITGNIKNFATYISLDHYLKQKYLGKQINTEYAFPAYSLLSARVSYKIPIWLTDTEFYVYGNNLLNQEARPQNSMLKYLSPLPGISVGAGFKINI